LSQVASRLPKVQAVNFASGFSDVVEAPKWIFLGVAFAEGVVLLPDADGCAHLGAAIKHDFLEITEAVRSISNIDIHFEVYPNEKGKDAGRGLEDKQGGGGKFILQSPPDSHARLIRNL
jgi:hypothetical protein